MGVPKFYRWISERYPCLSQVVKEHQIPEFDNLYLDMNGIIHTCSHPNDEDPHFRITEEKIFKDIFHYIEFLYRMIKPRKVFFMAVDGVAPRAKMNQQRGRRFRSAKEAEDLEKQARERGETLPTEARFDSNCITPGTEFMAKLHEQLKYFVAMKVSTDELWQGVDIYLSGHETPGEGEHKIMDFIRYSRSQEGYDPNTRHCLYGLDADLIMLGLCSHEPHFSLLREEVKFGRKRSSKNSSRTVTPEQTTFHLLHLSLMRDYLDHEFSALKKVLPFPYDLEKIIDDWVLMGFLVGNDFIPNLPHFHIQHDALPMLYKVYIECLPSLGGYINENGYLNLERFEKYVRTLSQIDYDKFNDTYADLKFFQSKTGRRMGGKTRHSYKIDKNNLCADLSKLEEQFRSRKNGPNSDPQESNLIELFGPSSDQNVNDNAMDDDGDDEYEDIGTDEEDDSEDDEDDDDTDLMELEFKQHKRDYYMNKLDYANVTPEVLQDQAYGYVRAIQWNLHYYYNGVASWSWYYPHHYAPYISDVKDFSGLQLNFELGKPFLPFQQLLAVLPAASRQLLPSAYQRLMTEENSPLKDYYPINFETDLNGKQQEWEAVVLIPFIEVDNLLHAVQPLDDTLTPDERSRNTHGPHLLYRYSKYCLPKCASSLPGVFPDIEANHAQCIAVDIDHFRLPVGKIKKGLLDGVDLNVYHPGFPTLRHIPHTSQLKKMEVKVFQYNSRGENMILTIKEQENKDIKNVANEYLGKEVFINWPHLEEAKVIEVADGDVRYFLQNDDDKKSSQSDIISSNMTASEGSFWRKQASSVQERYLKRYGIDVGDTSILVFAVPLLGRKYIAGVDGRITAEKQYSTYPVAAPLQVVVKDIFVKYPSFHQFKTVAEVYPVGSKCFMLGNPHYGCMGEVLSVLPDGRVRVQFQVPVEPKLKSVIRNQRAISSERYVPGYIAARKLGIDGFLLSRITGTFLIQTGNPESMNPGRVNIGLNLKFNNKNEEVPGYTKKIEDTWMYSDKAMKVLGEYLEKFPDMFSNLQRHLRDDMIHVTKIFLVDDARERLQEVQAWLKSLECTQLEHQKCGGVILDEGVVEAIEQAVKKNQEENRSERSQIMKTKPHLLYRPFHCHGNLPPDPNASFNLFDRIVNVREGFSVPLGMRGTIIGIHSAEKETDTMYDIVFDKEFSGGMSVRCSPLKGYQLPSWAMLNLTYGARQLQKAEPVEKSYAAKTEVASQPGPLGYSYAVASRSNAPSKQVENANNSGYSSSYVDPSINWSLLSAHSAPRMQHCSFVSPRLSQPLLDPSNLNKGPRWGTPKVVSSPLQGTPLPYSNNSPLNTSVSPAPTVSSPVRFNHSPNSPFVEKQQESEFNAIWEGLKNMNFGLPQFDLQQPSKHSNNESFKTQTPTAVPVPGKSVPVEALFEEARRVEQQSQNMFRNAQQVLPGHKSSSYNHSGSSPQTQATPSILRATDMLRQHCQQNFGGIPIYECIKSGPLQMHRAKVILPNGNSFYSITTKTPQEAYENAAEEALKHLNVKLPSSPKSGPALKMPNPQISPFAPAGNIPHQIPPLPNVVFPSPQVGFSSPRPSIAFLSQPGLRPSHPQGLTDIPSSYVSYNRQLLKTMRSGSDRALWSVDGVVQPCTDTSSQEREDLDQEHGHNPRAHRGATIERQSPNKSHSKHCRTREWVNSEWKGKGSGSLASHFDGSYDRSSQSNDRRHWQSDRNKKGSLNMDFQYPSMDKLVHQQDAAMNEKWTSKNDKQQEASASSSKGNPFVPLQVTQKQKHLASNSVNSSNQVKANAGRKVEATLRTAEINNLSKATNSLEHKEHSSASNKMTTPNSKGCLQNKANNGNVHHESRLKGGGASGGSGRSGRRSRIAAKFSNMQN